MACLTQAFPPLTASRPSRDCGLDALRTAGGKRLFIDVTDNGNAAGFVRVTLPLTARVGSTYFCARRADAISGKMPQGVIRDQDIGLVAYDNTYPATGNGHLVFSGSYEAHQV